MYWKFKEVFVDGERYAFLETKSGLKFDRDAYKSIADATSLEDVEDYVCDMIKNTIFNNNYGWLISSSMLIFNYWVTNSRREEVQWKENKKMIL